MDVREAIEAGLKKLEESEWIQGASHSYQDGKDAFCASAALEEAVKPGIFTDITHASSTEQRGLFKEAYDLLSEKAQPLIPEKHWSGGLVCYNDCVATKKEDVIKLFKDTLADLGDG